MFLENPAYNNEQFGWIEVICGSMFSGKTEELIRRVKRAKIANQKVKIFKPIIDSRSKNYIESHDDNKLESIEVKSSSEIFNKLKNCDVVAIGYSLIPRSIHAVRSKLPTYQIFCS